MVPKLFTVALLATAASCSPHLFPRQALPSCNRDNCYRAVAGTRPGVPASNTADCSSFFSVTATACAAASTVTVTTTSTSTSFTVPTAFDNSPQKRTLVDDLARRQNGVCTPTTVRPSSVPTYASACSGTARYSSACSCLIGPNGKTMTTTVVPAASTATSTVAATTTARGSVSGQYSISSGGFVFSDATALYKRPDEVTGFTINSQGHLTNTNQFNGNTETVYVDPTNAVQQGYGALKTADTPPAGAYIPMCVLTGGNSGQLLCQANVGGILFANFYLNSDGSLDLGSQAPPQGSLVTISRFR